MKDEYQNSDLYKARHSAEHVLTQAMISLYGKDKVIMAMGPATEEGFYFDFDSPEDFSVSEEDFPKIEEEMRKIVKENQRIERREVSLEEARKLFADNKYKQEWLDEIEAKGDKMVSIYANLDKDGNEVFVDLCKGPHVGYTKQVGKIKLLSIAGAYWRGDEKNKMLTRIYGTAFKAQDELDEYLWRIEEAKKRDHRKIGKEQKLFEFTDEVGPGLPLWMPRGTVIKEELEKWGKETEDKWGYKRVSTPFITKRKLFEVSGHVPYFEDEMYKVQVPDDEKEEYFVKPMNCPFHHMIFKAETHSYRDLPLRLAEYGTVARYEQSGSLNGILRPRVFVQNDAHVYCSEEQAIDEFVEIIDLHRYYYDKLGLKDYYIVLALRDPEKKDKYHGEEEMWQKAEELSIAAMEKAGIEYKIEHEGAAHYGPKMDFKIKSAIGVEYGISTNQIDLYMPERFGLKFVDKDGKEKPVVVQHRAPLGSSERFVGFLIEHFAGKFPAWLAPEQVAIIPIGEDNHDYADEVEAKLRKEGVRVVNDKRDDMMQAKIRDAQKMQIPYMLILGKREEEEGTVSIRYRDEKKNVVMKLDEFAEKLEKKIENKELELKL